FETDSIKFPDSLKHSTLVTKRTVYGGGGIMPDVFVPLDTSGINDMYRVIARSGYVNTFGLDYLDKNRKQMEKDYPDFATFKKNFECDKRFMEDFFEYVKKENNDFSYTSDEYKYCKDLLHSRLKASFARDLWGSSEFYQIYNDTNEILQKAIEVLEKNTYEKMNLATN
ncbi:peptidase S41, partial [Crocinitomicaceae bacterium]|nr:peptidase S41 [Crocinitomicaceae bacterium]